MVTWNDVDGPAPDTSAYSVHARRFDPYGNPFGDDFVVNTSDESATSSARHRHQRRQRADRLDGLCQPAGRHQPAQHPGAGLQRARLRLRQRRLWRLRRQWPQRSAVPEPLHRRGRDLDHQQRRRGGEHRGARLAAGRLQDRRHRQLQQHARRRHPAAQQAAGRSRSG